MEELLRQRLPAPHRRRRPRQFRGDSLHGQPDKNADEKQDGCGGREMFHFFFPNDECSILKKHLYCRNCAINRSLAHQKEFRILCWTPHWIWQKIGAKKKRREKITSAGFRERGKFKYVHPQDRSSSARIFGFFCSWVCALFKERTGDKTKKVRRKSFRSDFCFVSRYSTTSWSPSRPSNPTANCFWKKVFKFLKKQM